MEVVAAYMVEQSAEGMPLAAMTNQQAWAHLLDDSVWDQAFPHSFVGVGATTIRTAGVGQSRFAGAPRFVGSPPAGTAWPQNVEVLGALLPWLSPCGTPMSGPDGSCSLVGIGGIKFAVPRLHSWACVSVARFPKDAIARTNDWRGRKKNHDEWKMMMNNDDEHDAWGV